MTDDAAGRAPRRDVERNHARLARAAREVFSEEGIGAPLDRVASRAEVSRATLYRHFPDRDALWEAVLIEPLHGILDLVARAEAATSAVDGLVEYLSATGERAASPAGFTELMTTRFLPGSRLADLREQIQKGVDGLVERAKAEGGVRGDFEESDLALLTIALASVAQRTAEAAPAAWRRLLLLALEGVVPNGRASALPVAAPLRRNQVWRAFSSARAKEERP